MADSFRLASLAVLAQSVELPVGLTVDEVRIDASSAEILTAPFSVSIPEPAKVEVRVAQESVAAFLERKGVGGMSDVKVTAEENKLVIEGTAKVVVNVRVSATCTLRIVDELQLFVDLESLSVPGPLARNMVEGQLAKANPILDLAEFPVPLRLSSVSATSGQVVLTGTADWPQSS